MAADPAFAATPNIGTGTANATLDTSLTAPTNVTTIFTAGASGSMVNQVEMQALATTVAGVVNVFLHDGSTYHLVDQFLVPVVTSSTTARAWQASHSFVNLVLPTSSWTMRFTVTVSGLQSNIKGFAFGGDF